MSNDSISRVYQFLANQGDWVSAADKNGDGAVVKTEFRSFMQENFEWDGETTEAGKNDLINSFWNTIDTDQSGKISGTNLKDKNALNKDEIAAMQDRIEMYEILNEFTSTLSAPSVVQDAAGWKKSVSEGLGALVETFIKQGGKPDELEAYLEEKSVSVEQKATADYCANEYMKKTMTDLIQEYGYSYAEDGTLQDIINTYVKNIPEDSTFEDIYETVMEIIDAYTATAGLPGSENPELLSQYGYTYNEDSALNDLQKSIIKKNLEKSLEEIKNRADYEANSALYDSAINDYITNLLSGANFGEFEELQKYGIKEFEASDIYKTVEKTIEVQDIFNSEEFKSALSAGISASFAERLGNIMPGELEAYDKLVDEALAKATNGEFDDVNGNLDRTKLINWIVEEANANLTDFYPNGLGDMPLEDLSIMYDALVESAKEQQDAAKVKEAAISYCKALAAKSASLKQAVIDIFGDNYASEINKLLTGEIDTKIEELKAKAKEIGDASTFTVTGWNGLPADNTIVYPGNSVNYKISATIDSNGAQQRNITYSLLNVSGGTATCSQFGELSITAGSNEGYITLEVAVLADGIIIGNKSITLKCEKTIAGLVNTIGFDSWGGSSEHLEVYGLPGVGDGGAQVTSQSFADLYNNNAVIMLHQKNNNDNYTGTVKGRLSELCGYIVNALASKGLDKAKLQSASNHVIDTLMSNYGRKGKSDDNTEGTALGTRVCNKIKNGEFGGVVKFTDFKRKDYQVNMVSFKEVVDLILQEYGF